MNGELKVLAMCLARVVFPEPLVPMTTIFFFMV